MKEGGLGSFVILDGNIVLNRQLDGPLVGNGLGAGSSLNERQGPVVSVVGDSEEDFFRRDLGNGIVQNSAHIRKWGNGHRRTVCISPLVGHQEDTVRSGADGGVIMALIQKASLYGTGFRRQSSPEKSPLGVEQAAEAGKKGSIGGGQGAGKILEIHINAGVAPLKDGLNHLVDHTVLNRRVGQDQFTAAGVELAGFCQSGDVHDRAGAVGTSGGEQGVILQRQQATGGGDAIGEGCQISEIGELFIQKGGTNEGVGVSVGGGSAQFFVKV